MKCERGVYFRKPLIAVGGFVRMSRIPGEDEAIDAATSLARRELRERERLERGELPRR